MGLYCDMTFFQVVIKTDEQIFANMTNCHFSLKKTKKTFFFNWKEMLLNLYWIKQIFKFSTNPYLINKIQ